MLTVLAATAECSRAGATAAVPRSVADLPEGNWGIVDRAGELVSSRTCDSTKPFKGGRTVAAWAIGNSSFYAFLDFKGDPLFPEVYDLAAPFSDGMAMVEKDKKQGFIDETGRVGVDLGKFDEVFSFSEGLAAVALGKGDARKMGYIDRTGLLVIPAEFDNAWRFQEGLAAVRVRGQGDRRDGYIDHRGRIVIAPQSGQAYPFRNGFAVVSDGQKHGFIDRRGNMVISMRYNSAWDFSEGLARVTVGENHDQFIDGTGKVVLDLICEGSRDFHEGLASVCGLRGAKGRWGYIDKRGNIVIQPQFDSAGDFSEGLASVAVDLPRSGRLFGYIDASGNWAIKPRFLQCGPFSEGLAGVRFTSEELRSLTRRAKP